MRRTLFLSILILVALVYAVPAGAQSCTKIQSGALIDSAGNPIGLGYDKYGYNYQAHIFNGLYDNFSRPAVPVTDGAVNLIMKWSDDWLANQDCNGDGKLDRGLNAKTGVSTGTSIGWLTNQMEGDCITTTGDSIHATYFAKIVYDGGASCSASSSNCLWGLYTLLEEVGTDPSGGVCLDSRGLNRSSLMVPPGFGIYK